MPDRYLAARRLLAVTEEELQRIMLDIHDGPVQNLFAALSQVTLLCSRFAAIPQVPDECMSTLKGIKGLLETSLGAIRDLLGTFQVPEFVEQDIAEIVENIVVQHNTLTGSEVTLELSGTMPELALPAKIALCRILQEALFNVHRHAGVKTAAVRIWSEEGRLSLEVTDHGRGCELPPLTGPQATERHEHIGLRGIRERAALVGGDLTVQSRLGQGTRVRVEIPTQDRGPNDPG